MTRSSVVPDTSLTTRSVLVPEMTVDERYTNVDHGARDNDVYAIAKYRWTLRVLDRAALSSGTLVANIGCGAGTFTTMLAEAGYQVHAVEPDPVPYSLAKSRLPIGCSIENKSVFEIEGESRFDVIVMHDVLEHIEDDEAAARELSRLLKPGGLLLLSVPAMQALFGRHDEQLGHFRRYSKKRLKKVLENSTKIVGVRYYGFLSIPIVWVFSKKLRRDFPDVWGEGNISLVRRLYGVLCGIECRTWEPLGTSLLAVARNSKPQ